MQRKTAVTVVKILMVPRYNFNWLTSQSLIVITAGTPLFCRLGNTRPKFLEFSFEGDTLEGESIEQDLRTRLSLGYFSTVILGTTAIPSRGARTTGRQGDRATGMWVHSSSTLATTTSSSTSHYLVTSTT